MIAYLTETPFLGNSVKIYNSTKYLTIFKNYCEFNMKSFKSSKVEIKREMINDKNCRNGSNQENLRK